MPSTATTTRVTAAGGRWSGPAWWVLVAVCAVVGAVTTFFFSMYLLAWLMSTADLVADPVGTLQEIVRPGGVASQIGVQSLVCVVVLVAVTVVLVRAYRTRHGDAGRLGVRRVLLAVWTAVVTVVGGAWLVLFVSFTKLDLVDDAAQFGPWLGLVLPLLVATGVVTVVVLSWRRLLRRGGRVRATRQGRDAA